MYFNNFPTLQYEFSGIGEDKSNKSALIKDITTNIRFKKAFIEALPLVQTYKIRDGDTPEIISEKLYGNSKYHWILMLLNQRYDYIDDFPIAGKELEILVNNKYGSARNRIHHFTDSSGDIVNGYCTIKLTKNVTGSIIVDGNTENVIGANTSFLTQLIPGNLIYSLENGIIGVVKTINSNTSFSLTEKTEVPYNGAFKCVLPIEIGNVLKNKSATFDCIGRIESDLGNGSYNVMLTSSSFVAGTGVEVMKYYDDADGNFAQTLIGKTSISNVTYTADSYYKTNWEYEYELNEEKRELKVLPSAYLDQVLNEFNDILTK